MALFPLGILSAAGAGGAVAGAYELIETTILGSAQSSVTFSNLGTYSSTYKHLQLRFTARVTENIAGNIGTFYFTLNGDTASNYSIHVLRGNGSTVSSNASANNSAPDIGNTTGSGATANVFAAGVVDFLDVFSTTKNKTTRSLSGAASPNEIGLWSANWRSTSSVTSIALETFGANDFVAGCRFSLYGIRG